jgi:replication initiation protein RepC
LDNDCDINALSLDLQNKPSTGRRKLSSTAERYAKAAEAFAGLDERITKGKVIGAIKKAGPALGLTPEDTATLDALFENSWTQDWLPGSRPIVWPKNATLCMALKVKDRALADRLKRLQALGLIVMRDSPNKKRFGARDHNGHIVLDRTRGIDLSISGVRYAEFVAIAAAWRADYRAMQEARERASCARQALEARLETAEDEGAWSPEWDAFQTEVAPLAASLHTGKGWQTRGVEYFTAMAVQMEAAAARASEMLLREANHLNDKTAPLGAVEQPSNNIQTNHPETCSVTALRTGPAHAGPEKETKETADWPCSRGARDNENNKKVALQEEGGCASENTTTAIDSRQAEFAKLNISPNEIAEMTPELAAYCDTTSRITWSDLDAAANHIRGEWAIGHIIWGEALDVMTLHRRCVVFALILSRGKEYFNGNPGGYFASLVQLDRQRKLMLTQSVMGMRARHLHSPRTSVSPNADAYAMIDMSPSTPSPDRRETARLLSDIARSMSERGNRRR